jgi:cell pole-organizing protein PopZ
VDNLSIDEILDSIKKYVSSSENATDRLKVLAELPGGMSDELSDETPYGTTDGSAVRGEIEAIRLTPAFDEAAAIASTSTSYEDISMPTFIQKASEQVKKQTETVGHVKPQSIAEDVSNMPGTVRVEDTLRGFINDVTGIVTASHGSSHKERRSLDDIVVAEIKKAVALWIEENMQPLVKEAVAQELKRITDRLGQ